ncbi:MAG: FtsX-like permease family protein [bacterium]|nr:FtsX-like permease family protein [bacterium]
MTRSPLPVVLAVRYLKSGRKDSFVTFLSAVAAGGIAVGVAALILALSALAGFQSALRREILLRTPEIEIEVPDRVAAAALQGRLLAMSEVRSAQITARGAGWIAHRGSIRPVAMLGYEGPVPVIFPGAEGRPNGLYVPDSLADAWILEPGEVVEIASSRPTLTPLGPQPRVVRLAVTDSFDSGVTEQRNRIALPLAAAEALLGRSEYRVLVETGDLSSALSLVARLRVENESALRMSSWQDLNQALFFALRLEKTLMFLAVLLIVLVAALALVSDIHLIVASKRREIGILGAMGATRRTITRSFVLLGGALGLAGVAVGGSVGALLAWLLGRYQLLRLPASVYFLDHVPFEVEPGDVFLVMASALAIAALAAALGSRSAASLRPVEVLHR